MPRIALAAAIAALAFPAPLLAAPPAGAPHPSAAAVANAAQAQSATSMMAACTAATHGFLDDLTQTNYTAAVANFDGQMMVALPAVKLQQAWESVLAHYGVLQSRGDAAQVIYQGMPVVTVPLHFANGDLRAVLVCNASTGRFAGFHVTVAPAPTAGAAPASAPAASK